MVHNLQDSIFRASKYQALNSENVQQMGWQLVTSVKYVQNIPITYIGTLDGQSESLTTFPFLLKFIFYILAIRIKYAKFN